MQKRFSPIFVFADSGISPVIGVILMLLLTILLAGITVTSVYGDGFSDSLSKAPMAVIEVESVEGGVPMPNHYGYDQNYVILIHKGGDSLQTASTKITIGGEGNAYIGIVGNGNQPMDGEVLITYDDLTTDRKNPPYASHNPDILDGIWSAGEKLVLNGRDSVIGNGPTSVHVVLNGMTNTSDNYGLRENSIITIKIFDSKSDKIIAEFEHEVTPAQ
ncbi:type IV pilin N-terminal domain-containing protein [Methanolobus zinderi]|jgi:flagellin-like protein|uniref:Type IV pilin N-terminal domain-containing protein n=1 Tax=Methanolobus zinderi TaxID=536044 RepID=A0A7D5EA61_9EURY|nr:type IV pilin N-terminal domain-containing protein [Methanolobus zinderi]KXS44546.1 MAG: hypothetical protein AWU59_483 [Methanolobus sp. T82-4]QLC50997.1 type IV pilin N-terminal domain-containing protein [Methanolobus zinderi]